MTNDEKQKFKAVLQGMCNAMNIKPLDEAGMSFWMMTLADYSYTDVASEIFAWCKTQKFPPRPADIVEGIKAKRAIERDAARPAEDHFAPMAPEVAKEYERVMTQSLDRNIPIDAWARRLMIKEAYGFFLTAFEAAAWRRGLAKSVDYKFEDYGDTFPIEQGPDERRSLYHDCHLSFIKEYEAKHGFGLAYDRDLAFKRYPSAPLRRSIHDQNIGSVTNA